MNLYEVLIDYPDVLTPEDVQEILHLSRSTVYELLMGGVIKSIRIGKKYRIPKLYMLQFLYPGTDFFDLERGKREDEYSGDNPPSA